MHVFHNEEETPKWIMYTDPPHFCDEEVAEQNKTCLIYSAETL